MKINIPNSLHIQEPWLTHIQQGTKKVEGRKGTLEKYQHLLDNDVVFFNENKIVKVHIIEIRHYATLYDYLDKEDYKKVLPGIETYEKAVSTYHKFYTNEQIKENGGMCALVFELV
ncbi:ASCH domain protein [Hokovirus HKV1]|uniref:ASCH domain protein n=1 Tax=Hokovirus HKV1 TaxID=1977638 RepID=A0A1V0SG20_9VIRU|nr:ASCH domain protein [Hokovirus HKV1]